MEVFLDGQHLSDVAPEVFLERCAGLDVHQTSVVCCVLIGAPGRKAQKLLRSFGTTTRELEALRAWLAEHDVTHVGMGTRDLLLSNTVRVHQKLRQSGVEADLQVFEGQSHAQYSRDDRIPEDRQAFEQIAAFFDRHLGH